MVALVEMMLKPHKELPKARAALYKKLIERQANAARPTWELWPRV